MMFDQNMIIDATRGSIARFVNHSCEPNCRMEKWTVAGKPRMALFAGDEGIVTGEELTYDYNFEYVPRPDRDQDRLEQVLTDFPSPFSSKNIQECRCGSLHCRGVLGPRSKEKDANGKSTTTDSLAATSQSAKSKNGTKRKLSAGTSADPTSPKKRKIAPAKSAKAKAVKVTAVKNVKSTKSVKDAKAVKSMKAVKAVKSPKKATTTAVVVVKQNPNKRSVSMPRKRAAPAKKIAAKPGATVKTRITLKPTPKSRAQIKSQPAATAKSTKSLDEPATKKALGKALGKAVAVKVGKPRVTLKEKTQAKAMGKETNKNKKQTTLSSFVKGAKASPAGSSAGSTIVLGGGATKVQVKVPSKVAVVVAA